MSIAISPYKEVGSISGNHLQAIVNYSRSAKGLSEYAKGIVVLFSLHEVWPDMSEWVPQAYEILGKMTQPLKSTLKFFSVVHLANAILKAAYDVFRGEWYQCFKEDLLEGVLRWVSDVTVYGADLGIAIFTHIVFGYVRWFGLIYKTYSDIQNLVQVFAVLPQRSVGSRMMEIAKILTNLARSAIIAVGLAWGISLPVLGVSWAVFDFSIKTIHWWASFFCGIEDERRKIGEQELQHRIYDCEKHLLEANQILRSINYLTDLEEKQKEIEGIRKELDRTQKQLDILQGKRSSISVHTK
ncbi:MAG: hypothetical protein JW769_05055 [Parachlamydiales bacterium]|nr:hypothetical protein [Parachlamydiales bacterium]